MILVVVQEMNEYWRSHVNTTLKSTTVVSTGGGFRDLLVRPGVTAMDGLTPADRSISTNVSALRANLLGVYDIPDPIYF